MACLGPGDTDRGDAVAALPHSEPRRHLLELTPRVKCSPSLPSPSSPPALAPPAPPPAPRAPRGGRLGRDARSRPSAFAAATLAATLVLAPADPAAATTVFAGKYIDPNHPHCPREIDADGVITGYRPRSLRQGSGCRGYKKKNEAAAIEAGKINPWTIKAKIAPDDKSIFIDFDQKDGSGESFTGVWNGRGIEFPDGNVWAIIKEGGLPTSGAALSSK